jgi:transposase InsO family protein
LRNFELQDNQVYRKPVLNPTTGELLPARYVATYSDVFENICNTHEALMHFAVNKTYERLNTLYFGITRADVKWVLDRCRYCNIETTQKEKKGVKPIVSEAAGQRLVVDLMDFRAAPDGEYCWVWQLKCHFSKYVWIKALKAKTAEETAEKLRLWCNDNGHPPTLHCDNGTEFKGAMLEYCKEHNINVINGRPYHPESQGSIEVANKTFKARLRAVQSSYPTIGWKDLLPNIAWVINTTRPDSLPHGTIPYEVWFGRKPPQMPEELHKHREVFRPIVIEEAIPDPDSDDTASGDRTPPEASTSDSPAPPEEETASVSASEATTTTTLNQRVIKHNAKENLRMIRRKGGKAATQYELQEVATLQIPVKLRVGPDLRRLPVRIIEAHEKGYKLVCEYGELTCLHSSKVLNKLVSQSIYTYLPIIGGNKISLNKAVQRMNGRETISASQKAGRKANKRKGVATTEAPLAKRAAVREAGDDEINATGRVEVWAEASGNGMTTRARASKSNVA